MVANDDDITLPVDSILSRNVAANDINMRPPSSFVWVTSKPATYAVPPSTTPVALAALSFSSQGLISLNPAANAALRPGVVITFMYYVQANVAGLPKSNNATVTITIAAAGEHAAAAPLLDTIWHTIWHTMAMVVPAGVLNGCWQRMGFGTARSIWMLGQPQGCSR